MSKVNKTQKQAEVREFREVRQVRKFINCFIMNLPRTVKSWPDFMKYIGVHIFPQEILPLRVNKNGKIEMNEDGSYVIAETPHTIQLIELKSFPYNDRSSNYSGTKYNISFRVPIPRESDPFYDYMMDELITPLQTPLERDEDDYEPEKKPMARMGWEFRGRDYYVTISQSDDSDDIPCQTRFQRMSVRDD